MATTEVQTATPPADFRLLSVPRGSTFGKVLLRADGWTPPFERCHGCQNANVLNLCPALRPALSEAADADLAVQSGRGGKRRRQASTTVGGDCFVPLASKPRIEIGIQAEERPSEAAFRGIEKGRARDVDMWDPVEDVTVGAQSLPGIDKGEESGVFLPGELLW